MESSNSSLSKFSKNLKYSKSSIDFDSENNNINKNNNLDRIVLVNSADSNKIKQIRFENNVNNLNPNSNNNNNNNENGNGAYYNNYNYNKQINKSQAYHSSMDYYRLKLSKSKLKAVTRTSALLSGFAMVAMVELGLDYSSLLEYYNESSNDSNYKQSKVSELFNSSVSSNNRTSLNQMEKLTDNSIRVSNNKYNIPQSILIIYALVTCLLVGVHMLALMISTCILPQLEALNIEHFDWEQYLHKNELSILNQTTNSNQTHEECELDSYENKNNSSTLNRRNIDNSRSSYHPVGYDSILNDSNAMMPHIQYYRFIELAWISSTVLGIFLFLVEIGLVCYIKFYPISFMAALTGAIVMFPILVLFVVFTITFYKRLAGFKVNLTKKVLSQVENDHSVRLNSNII